MLLNLVGGPGDGLRVSPRAVPRRGQERSSLGDGAGHLVEPGADDEGWRRDHARVPGYPDGSLGARSASLAPAVTSRSRRENFQVVVGRCRCRSRSWSWSCRALSLSLFMASSVLVRLEYEASPSSSSVDTVPFLVHVGGSRLIRRVERLSSLLLSPLAREKFAVARTSNARASCCITAARSAAESENRVAML